MPNTNAEVLKAKNAVALIAKRYQPYLMGNPDLDRLLGAPTEEKFSASIKYMDQPAFRTNLAAANLGRRQRAGCTVNGFTSDTNGVRTIFVNRDTAMPATIIHELLHFFTHRVFMDRFASNVVEGLTEYFTRATQSGANPDDREAFSQFCKENSPRTGIYMNETRAISQIDQHKLTETTNTRFVLENAYFKGETNALGALEFALQRPELFARASGMRPMPRGR